MDAIDNTLNMREAGVKYVEKDTINKGFCKLRIPLLFYNDTMNLIPDKYSFDSVNGRYLLSPTFSHVVEIIVKYE
ncbi:MAG TPA: hypothetical protein PKI01_10045 [Bacteroidales bacterium]|nr:hypothetical protein [Bacteroidales bacterium]